MDATLTGVMAIHPYKARLDSATEAERWDEADRIRVAAKRRLLEMMSRGCGEDEIAAIRDALADSFARLQLSKRVRIGNGPLAMAARISADAETAAIAAEQAQLPEDTARNVKDQIIQHLSQGNKRPMTTSELKEKTDRRIETVSRALSQLRAERKIVSHRKGRHVLHQLTVLQREGVANSSRRIEELSHKFIAAEPNEPSSMPLELPKREGDLHSKEINSFNSETTNLVPLVDVKINSRPDDFKSGTFIPKPPATKSERNLDNVRQLHYGVNPEVRGNRSILEKMAQAM